MTMTTEANTVPDPDPSWRSDKAHEEICEAAERIANHYCSEDDTYSLEVKRLTVAISEVVDRIDSPAAPDERDKALAHEQEADMLSKLQVAINSCRDVTTLGRFAPSVDPVRWVVQLQAYLESLIEAEAGWHPDPRHWQPVEDELESARTGKVE